MLWCELGAQISLVGSVSAVVQVVVLGKAYPTILVSTYSTSHCPSSGVDYDDEHKQGLSTV
jgi:hypothetical protein